MIACCVRNCCAGGVCVDFIHSSWRQEGRDAIVYTKSEKDRHISISSSPKKHCDTMIAYCVRNCCTGGVCRFCTQVMGTRGEMRLSTQIQKRTDRSQSHPLQNILRHKDCILCEKLVWRWCVSIFYTGHGDRREMQLSTQIQKRTDRSQSNPIQKILWHKDRILCEKLVCRWCVCRFCTQVMATGERCNCLHKIRKGQTDLNLILSKKYCDTRIT